MLNLMFIAFQLLGLTSVQSGSNRCSFGLLRPGQGVFHSISCLTFLVRGADHNLTVQCSVDSAVVIG